MIEKGILKMGFVKEFDSYMKYYADISKHKIL